MAKYSVALRTPDNVAIIDADKKVAKSASVSTKPIRKPGVLVTTKFDGIRSYSGYSLPWPKGIFSKVDLVKIEKQFAAAKKLIKHDPRPLEQMVSDYLKRRKELEVIADKERADFENFADVLRRLNFGESAVILAALKKWMSDPTDANEKRLKRLGAEFLGSKVIKIRRLYLLRTTAPCYANARWNLLSNISPRRVA